MTPFTTPDLYDEHMNEVLALSPMLRSFGGKSTFSGPIVTIKCHEDNSLVKEQVSQAGEGKILVVDGGGSRRCALLGDQLAEKAWQNDWSGLIIFGCIRDVDQIATMSIGVKAIAATPVKSIRKGWGELNVPVVFGGVSFQPGYYVYADNNGVLLSAKALQ